MKKGDGAEEALFKQAAKAELNVPSKKSLIKAGDILRTQTSGPEFEMALNTLSDWRGLFAFPLNTFRAALRSECLNLECRNAIVACRLKRTPSIVAKLRRFPEMQLGRMQDIGGLRVIVDSVEEVYKVWEGLQASRMKHEAIIPPHDYIKAPKPDGYRSLHQVYRYQSKDHPELCGIKVEIQIRTQLQHAWATAVETLGVIEHESFKTGEGDGEYKRFFKLASALISLHEDCPVLDEYRGKSKDDLIEEFKFVEKKLGVFGKLTGVAVAAKHILSPNTECADYQVMMLDPRAGTLSLTPFSKEQIRTAEKFYTFLEATEKDKLVVLVSVGNLKGLKKAYPNYFLDTKLFIETLESIVNEAQESSEIP